MIFTLCETWDMLSGRIRVSARIKEGVMDGRSSSFWALWSSLHFLRKGVAAVIATVNETRTRPNNPITLVVGKIQEEAAVNIQYIILNHLHNDDSEP